MKSIILPAFEVCGILNGKITQIRRPVKIPYIIQGDETSHEHVLCGHIAGNPNIEDGFYAWLEDHPDEGVAPLKLLQVGQVLWVKETWQEFFDDELPQDRFRGVRGRMGIPAQPNRLSYVAYRADGDVQPPQSDYGKALWRPSWCMPKKFSRLKIEVTSTRVQRWRDITEEDAQACGMERDTEPCDHIRHSCDEIDCLGQTYVASYAEAWGEAYGKKYCWDDNPWTAVYGVRRVQP